MGELFDQLTDKYMRFVSEYTVSGNLAASAKAAGSKAKNLSQAGREILNRPEVWAAIKDFKADLAESLKITPERILKEYARIGFSNINQYIKGGKLVDIGSLDEDAAAALCSVKVITKERGSGDDIDIKYVHEIKFWSKNNALEAMGKHLGFFEADNDQKKEHIVILHDPSRPDANGDT